ncbi:MAG: agmatine deiminase family protein [Saprospiraceae bacterium]|nr:agmatine deiminase family protein [Lewinella sp.]
MKRLCNALPDLSRLYLLVLYLSILFCIACNFAPETDNAFRPAADFEEQESTMLCWNEDNRQVLLALISKIAETDHVSLFYNENNYSESAIRSKLVGAAINIEQVEFLPFNLQKDNIWIRDYGPSYMMDGEGNRQIVGFDYTHKDFEDYKDFTLHLSEKMQIPFLKSRLYSEGGGHEINGKGTILLIEGYEKEVNPGLSKEEIEAEYREKFLQTNFIWLKRGIPQDDFIGYGPVIDNIYGYGTNWHVDEFCRFADPHTILLAEVNAEDLERDPFYKIIHERLEENYQILSKAVDQDGKPFRIVRVPQAPVVFAAGKRADQDIMYTPVTSYLNFVITNHAVIIPSYFSPGSPSYVLKKDTDAFRTFQKVFPSRKITRVDALELNYKGGGLHCVTLSKPGKRKIRGLRG